MLAFQPMEPRPPPAPARPPAQVRAIHTKANLELLRDRSPEEADRVVAALGPEALADLETAAPLAWLPAERDVEMATVLDQVLGRDRARLLAREIVLRDLRSGLLARLVEGAVKLFGLTPAGILHWMPRGFSAIVRGAGALRVEPLGPTATRLVFDDLHPSVASACWLGALAAGTGAVLDLTRHQGTVEIEQLGPVQARWVVRWEPLAGGAAPAQGAGRR